MGFRILSFFQSYGSDLGMIYTNGLQLDPVLDLSLNLQASILNKLNQDAG